MAYITKKFLSELREKDNEILNHRKQLAEGDLFTATERELKSNDLDKEFDGNQFRCYFNDGYNVMAKSIVTNRRLSIALRRL